MFTVCYYVTYSVRSSENYLLIYYGQAYKTHSKSDCRGAGLRGGILSFIGTYQAADILVQKEKTVGKELSFCHKLRFSNYFICATQSREPQIFQIRNSGILNSQSLKYQRFTPSCCRDIGIIKFEFVANTQFLMDETFN